MLIFESYKEFSEIKKFRKIIPKFVFTLADSFHNSNKNLYVVGGAVRDFLMKKTPKDFDLATDALPEETEKIIQDLGYKTIPVGKKFGIIVAVDEHGDEFEIATLRSDIGKGRRPDAVEFTTIDRDVLRRDLTINALFYDLNKNEIVDLVGGISDILNGVIRTVGNPQDRFEEDSLRKLRAIRFFARSGKTFDKDTAEALRDTSLEGVSSERIYNEFKSGLRQAKSPKVFIETLNDFNYLPHIFPNLKLFTNKFINSNNIIVQAAYILQNETNENIKLQLNNASWTNEEISIISWLVQILEEDLEKVYVLIRKRDQLKLTDNIKDEWLKIFNTLYIKKVFNYNLSNINVLTISKDIKDKSKIPLVLNKEILQTW